MAKEKKQPEVIDGIRFRRARKSSFKFKNDDIFTRVKKFAETWDSDRDIDRDERIQREAKFRQWTDGKDWPFPDSSDIRLPDMTTQSLRVQDTLHNAVMSARPPVTARAMDKASAKKAETVDKVIDHQLFIDLNGEEMISEMADAFTNDGHYVAFVPWVKEKGQVSDVLKFPAIPAPAEGEEQILPQQYFTTIIQQTYPNAQEALPKGQNFWDWKITTEDGNEEDVAFFTTDTGEVEMVINSIKVVFDGPRPIIKEWEEVLYPPRAANLQAPSISNPKGAEAVILVDYPTLDEVTKLQKNGWYDGLTADDIKALSTAAVARERQEMENAKDTFDGVQGEPKAPITGAESHKRLTRYLCFDRFDIDGDGIDEDVMWWVIKEANNKVAKAKLMTEMYPFKIPRRPLAHASFIPIRGRVAGISQLELTEGTHDAMKIAYDQMTDSSTITNSPFFFYRAAGGMQPEVIRLAPGEGYPLMDPSRDVHFPNIQSNAGAAGMNTIGLLTNMQERLTLVGDQSLGRVPPGGATALRTVTGMAMLQNNAEARPERILRRFYIGLRDIYTMCHELNEIFLPKNKKILLSKTRSKEEEAYETIESRDMIRGQFIFDFDANAFNTSRSALQEAMTSMMSTFITPLNLQLGIINEEGIYRLQRDWARIIGQDPDQYLSAPTPDAMLPKIFAEDVLLMVANGQKPFGVPAEAGGAAEHLQKIQAIAQTDEFGFLDKALVASILNPYLEQVSQRALEEQKQQQLQQAAQQFGAQGQQGAAPEGAPPQGGQQDPNAQPTNVQPGQLADQTLPGPNGNGSGNR